MLDRRQLLAHLATLAGLAVVPVPVDYPMTVTPILALKLEYERAVTALMGCCERGDFSAWEPGAEHEKPERWRLARAVVASGQGDMTDPMEARVFEALKGLWVELTRPKAAEIIEIMEWPGAS